MKYLTLFIAPLSSAFVIQQNSPSTNSLYSSNTFEVGENLDFERARECSEQFGKCSIEEVEELRDSVHEARIRDTLVDKMTHGQTASRVYEERLLEENLTLQLNLLKQEMPDSALFPVDKMKVPESTESTPPRNNQAMNLLNENTLESLVICAVFGLMLFVAPHI